MALEDAGGAQGESARYGTTTAKGRPIPLGLVVFGVLLAATVLFFGLGFSFAFTQGDSMEPNYHDGSLVIKREVEPSSLKVGDVISFYAPWAQRRVMHRVDDIRTKNGQLWFRTKGDNNPVPDPEEITFQDEKPQRIVFAMPGGLEAAGAVAAAVLGLFLGLFAVKVISDLVSEGD